MAYVTSHGTRIYYELHGAGPTTIVFAHGMGGNGAIWFQQLARFSSNYRIVTFDHRYFARSACPEAQFDPRLFPDDMIAVLDAANVDDAVFVCQSMGGWTGSQMAVNHPERVRALVMSHTPGIFVSDSAANDSAAVARQVARPSNPFASQALAPDYPQRNLAGAILYAQIGAFNGIDPAVIPRAIGAAGLAVNTASLTDYAIPTLFITADKDALFPRDYIQALAMSLPGGQFVSLGDAGHSSYFEVPDAFNDALAGFLEQHGF